jgi:hypothetical protein
MLLNSGTAMNILRMVKLFGWEGKMNEKISKKREEELVWMWKRQVLNLTKGLLKYVQASCWIITLKRQSVVS